MNGVNPDDMPPVDLEAEAALIGAVLFDQSQIDHCGVSPDDFYVDRDRAIFAEILTAHTAGIKVDLVVLNDRMKAKGTPCFERLVELSKLSVTPNPANAPHYARQVRDAAIRRRLLHAAFIIEAKAKGNGPPDELLDEAKRLIERAESTRAEQPPQTLADAIAAANAERSEEATQGLPTGLRTLDRILGGLRPGQLVVLAGRTSTGKTTLAQEIAKAAGKTGERVLFFSLEMGRAELGERFLAASSLTPAGLRDLTEREQRRRDVVGAKLAALPMEIETDPQTVASIASRARRTKRAHGLGLIVVDYLQLLTPENPREPREQQIAGMTRGLKQLARQLEVPILVLAQLNRQAETERPKLSHLRESGAIEQDADVVLLIHRAIIDSDDAPRGETEIIVAKARNGPTGVARCRYVSSCTRYVSCFEG